MYPRPMPRPVTPTADTASAATKARFWNRVARKFASDPIADVAGYEATLGRVQALLSPERFGLTPSPAHAPSAHLPPL